MHFFNSPKPGQLVGKLNWRITTPDGEFFTRDVVQKFKQDPANPAHLVNKDNEYLHYRGEAGTGSQIYVSVDGQPSLALADSDQSP